MAVLIPQKFLLSDNRSSRKASFCIRLLKIISVATVGLQVGPHTDQGQLQRLLMCSVCSEEEMTFLLPESSRTSER